MVVFPRRLGVVAFLLAAITRTMAGQITSGAISGTVTDGDTQTRLASAAVTITHVPTGEHVDVRTAADGRFIAANLRPGGPYTVAVRMVGYAPTQKTNVAVTLGATTVVPLVVSKAAVQLQAQVVSASRASSGVTDESSVTTAVSREQLHDLPSLSRSLQDYTRLTPSGNGISFGGSNYRYNNLAIDGALSNDAFGFSPSTGSATSTIPTSTPGGLAKTQPISLDAVDAVTVSMAPFDVRQGGFTGASMNAVTKSGTNTPSVSGYYYFRNSGFVGDGLSGGMQNDFKELQGGGHIGGPIVHDKAFYFLSGEVVRHTDPVMYAPGSNGALLTAAQAQQVSDAAKQFAAASGYANFDPGNVQTYSIPANSTKLFGRFDFALGNGNSLSIRDNYVDATAGTLERGAALTKFASADFQHKSTTNGLVAELKSQVGSMGSNSLIAGLSFVSDKRVPYGVLNGSNQIFPQIEITDPSFGQLNIGSDRESAVYRQKTRTIELTDNFTWATGKNTFTLGTHNEFYNVKYTFVQSYNGRWQYPSLTAFLQQHPSRIRATYVLGDNSLDGVLNTPGADFNVIAPSLYAEDAIQLTSSLTITPGVRFDFNSVDTPTDRPDFNSFTSVVGGSSTQPFAQYKNDFGSSMTFGPRLGFSYDPKHDQSVVVRGGLGVFAGRMPFAWYAYPFLNNGIYSANVDYRPAATATVPLIADPAQQKNVNTLYGQGNQYEIDLIDNNFVQPIVARYDLGTDFPLGGGVKATIEGTYTQAIKDVFFEDIDVPAAAGHFGGADNRPFYAASRLNGPGGTSAATDNIYSSVYLLTNTNKGYRYNVTGSLDKTFTFTPATTLHANGSYTYGMSKDVANGQRNSPQSSFEYHQVVTPNVPVLAYSNYDTRHRIVGTAVFNHDWSAHNHTNLSLVYTGASGSPFSYVYNSDLNNDGTSNNDLIFIPKDASQITLTTNNWDALDAYIKSDPYLNAHRGQYEERNGPRTPWNHRLDARITQAIPAPSGSHAVEITLDIFNLTNMLSSSWGKQYYVPNLNNQDVFSGLALVGARADGVAPSFSFAAPAAGTKPYQVDDFTSRWQMQLGLRYTY